MNTARYNALTQQIFDYLLMIGIINSSNFFTLRLPYYQFIKFLMICIVLIAYIPRLTRFGVGLSILFGLIAARAQMGFSSGLSLSFFHAFVTAIFMTLIVLIPIETKVRLYQVLKNLLVVILSVGLFFHILRMLGLFSEPSLLVYTDSEGGRQWLVLPTQTYNIVRGQVISSRFCSVIAEPGGLGMIATFVLALSNYKLTTYKNFVIFLSGIFTLSLSFYFLSAVYIGLQYVTFSSLKENTLRIVLVLFIIVIVIFLFPILQDNLGNRFQLAEEGGGLQDSRANLSSFKEYWNLLGDLPINKLLFGGAFEEARDLEINHVSWVQYVYRMGVIVGFLWLLFCIILSIKLKGNWLFVIVFILLINHRPQVITPFHFFMLSIAISVKSIREPDKIPLKISKKLR